jgi:hypothetical protein
VIAVDYPAEDGDDHGQQRQQRAKGR